MEIALINRQDVAEPDQAASGVAGTGLKDKRKTGIVEHTIKRDVAKKNRIVLGMGVLCNGGTTPSAPRAVPASCVGAGAFRDSTPLPEDPGTDPCERLGDVFFSAFERQERTCDRMNRKITRLDRRLNKLDGRRKEKRDEKRESK